MRILCVDPGEKRLGIAISDPGGAFASPRGILKHVSKSEDSSRIAALAAENGCGLILVGVALDDEGGETGSSRQARNLVRAIEEKTEIPVLVWDESGSTGAAQKTAIELGLPRKKRQGHLDSAAAAVILQSYLDFLQTTGGIPNE